MQSWLNINIWNGKLAHSFFLISVLQTVTADLGSDPVNPKDVDVLCSRFLHAWG